MITPSKRNALSHFQRWSATYERSWLQPRLFEPAQVHILFQQAGLHVLHQQSAVSGWVLITVGRKRT